MKFKICIFSLLFFSLSIYSEPIFKAIQDGDLQKIDSLVSSDNVNNVYCDKIWISDFLGGYKQGSNYFTPLSFACSKLANNTKLFVPVVQSLVSKGANLNQEYGAFDTPLKRLLCPWGFHKTYPCFENVQFLVEAGANVNFATGNSPLNHFMTKVSVGGCLSNEEALKIFQFLVDKGARLEDSDLSKNPLFNSILDRNKDLAFDMKRIYESILRD